EGWLMLSTPIIPTLNPGRGPETLHMTLRNERYRTSVIFVVIVVIALDPGLKLVRRSLQFPADRVDRLALFESHFRNFHAIEPNNTRLITLHLYPESA